MKFDIYTITEESLSVEVIANRVNSSRNKNITKKGLRLFEDQKIYASSYVGKISDEELLKIGKLSQSVGIPYSYEVPSFESTQLIDQESLSHPLASVYEDIERAQSELNKYSNEFVFNGKFNRSTYHISIKNEAGQTLEKKYTTNDWHYLFKQVGSPNILDGYFGNAGRGVGLDDVLSKNLPFISSYKNEIKFQAGKYPVLFIDSSELFHKLSESLRADKYFEGSALYSDKLGHKILGSGFSLYDVNYSPKHSLLRRFDDEGIVRSQAQFPLIENGVFKNVISDLRNAHKYQIHSTGNGMRGFNSAASIGFNSLVVNPGSRSTTEILASLEDCILVFMGHGGDFTDKGEFSTPLHLAYHMKKGEIVGRLPQLTVKTSVNEMFNTRLMEIASDGFQEDMQNPSLFIEMDVFLN